MEPQEILHEIVKTDLDARELYGEAVRNREAVRESLREKAQTLKQDYYAQADRRIEAFEKNEIKKADEEVAGIDRQFESYRSAAGERFERCKEQVALKMFDIVVGRSE